MKKKFNPAIVIAAGCLTGFINGTFGGGGGMIAVPALTFILGIATHKAHATAILVILPLSVISAFIYFLHTSFEKQILVPVSIGVFFGGLLGAKLLPFISGKYLTVIFALIMLAAGIKMVFI